MTRCSQVLYLFLFFAPVGARAEGTLDGNWTMTFKGMEVDTPSWGPDCGPKPKPYRQQLKRPVTVKETNGQLIVVGGGTRTDACGSVNPKVRTVSTSRLPSKWRRVCETGSDDPRFERGVYTVEANGSDTLVYTAESKFDWTLKGNHCVANVKETRRFARETKASSSGEAPAAPKTSTGTGDDGPENDAIPPLGCERPGPPKWVTLSPKRARLGPSQTVCFEATVRDEKGCSLDVTPKWSVSQKGNPVPGLVSHAGCFRSGATAADAEGKYTVTARAGGRSAVAEVDVVFGDLDGLLAARLEPLDDMPSAGAQPTAAKTAAVSSTVGNDGNRPTTAAPLQRRPPFGEPSVQTSTADSGMGFTIVLLLLFVLLGAATGGVVFYILRGRSRQHEAETREFDAWPEDIARSDSGFEVRNNSEVIDHIAQRSNSVVLSMKCNTCGRMYESDAQYCPHDQSALVASVAPADVTEAGMICPACNRGYDTDARYCPHDAERLIPYTEWREQKGK